ncbi:MAG: release factor glutamine methyltransferase [Gammaproteobacteria bacterium]|jgi:release factor glutamine methyltransferase
MTSVAECVAQYETLVDVSDSAKRDVEILLCHCLKKSSSYLLAWPDADVSGAVFEHFQTLLKRRKQGEPIAYLVGEKGFWTLDLLVSPATLIPRPETELLVEAILELYSDQDAKSILDLGTGTGAIALALASENPQWKILGCDVEMPAIDLANANRQRLLPDSKNVSFAKSDWFDDIKPQAFDLIVSNPPYIDPKDPHLLSGDVRFEPASALVSQNEGLFDIQKIILRAPDFLTSSGWLLFEHGYNQAASVRQFLVAGGFQNVFTRQDLNGLDRISGGHLGI